MKKKKKESKIGTKGEIHEINIRQPWKALYTYKVTSFLSWFDCISMTWTQAAFWELHRSSQNEISKSWPKKMYCQTCPCPAVLSKKNWRKNLPPSKYIAQWAAVPQPEDRLLCPARAQARYHWWRHKRAPNPCERTQRSSGKASGKPCVARPIPWASLAILPPGDSLRASPSVNSFYLKAVIWECGDKVWIPLVMLKILFN